VIKKSLFTSEVRRKTHCISTVPTQLMIWRWPSQNTFGLWTVLYWTRSSITQFGMSIHVWRLVGDSLNITCNFLYCNHQVHRDFLSPCISSLIGRRVCSDSHSHSSTSHTADIYPLTLELNPSAQRCLMRFFTRDFASLTVHFVNICMKNKQMQQLFIQFINYVR
jgi:hypothetical protein